MSQRNNYEYVGAGLFPISHGGIAIYVKHTTNPPEIRMMEQSTRHAVIRCPDRTLYLVGEEHYQARFPIDFSFDEVVYPAPFWPRTGANTGTTNYMMNYVQHIGKEHNSANARLHGRLPEHNQTLIADSGGFQIQSERFDFISPHKLVDWYNRNVDLGMVLDFPSGGMWWPGLLDKMAAAQNACTDILLKNKRPDLELLNIFHGETFEDVQNFRSIVERPEIDRLAIGGTYYASILHSIHYTAQIMMTGKKYKHYHMLGVSNIRQLYLVMRMASQGVAEYITSDSSTFLQEALNKGYYVWPEVAAPMRYYKIGDKTNRPNSGKILPCSCPVCSALKYSDIFSVFSGNVITFLHMYHNLFAFESMIRGMYDIIRDSSVKELKQLMRRQFSTRSAHLQEVLSGLDYVDEVAANGLESGAKKVAYFLNATVYGTESSRSLFGAANQSDKGTDTLESRDKDPEHSVIETFPKDNPRRVRMERILAQYISGDAEKNERVKKDERIREAKGHTKVSSGGIKVPGKAKKKAVKKDKKDKTKGKAATPSKKAA